MEPKLERSLEEMIPDEFLLQRAVFNCRSPHRDRRIKWPRWVHVMDVFALGSTFSHQLCIRFKLNPDEEI